MIQRILAISTLTLFAAIATAGDQLTAPRLYIKPTTYDLGTLDSNTPADATIKIINTGDQPLHVAHTCTCGTRGSAWSRDIAPNQFADLPVTLDPGDSRPGKLTRSIKITSNDPLAPETRVTLTADYQPLVYLNTPSIDFGQINPNVPAIAHVTILSRDKDLEFVGLKTDNPAIKLSIVPDESAIPDPHYPGRKYIELTLEPGPKPARFQEPIEFLVRTQNPKRETSLAAKAVGDVVTDLVCTPRFINFGDTPPGTPLEARVTITSTSGTRFVLAHEEVIDSTLPGVTVTADPDEPLDAAAHAVIIKGCADRQIGVFRGSVQIRTTLPNEQPIRIEFHGTIRNPPPEPR